MVLVTLDIRMRMRMGILESRRGRVGESVRCVSWACTYPYEPEGEDDKRAAVDTTRDHNKHPSDPW